MSDRTPRTTFITSLENAASGIRVNINRIADGRYAVTLTDLDCGETLAVALLFNEYGPALAYATRAVAEYE